MKDNLGDRMKKYEGVWNSTQLIPRTPIIIRLDGKAFHSYLAPLKGQDPFDHAVHLLMGDTMIYLCQNIQGAVFGYTQSDEISILLRDWDTFETQQWFGGNKTKIETIAASMATGRFNHQKEAMQKFCANDFPSISLIKQDFALFDARAFNLPKEEVTNYFIWRQKDAIRNSVSALAQHHFAHKVLQGMKVPLMKDLLLSSVNIDWNQLKTWKQRGICWSKEGSADEEIPVFTDNREYVEKHLVVTENAN